MARLDELEKKKPEPAEGAEGGMEVDSGADPAAILAYHELSLRDGLRAKVPEELLLHHREAIVRFKADKVANLSESAQLQRLDQHIEWNTTARDKTAEKLTKMRDEYKALQEKWVADLRELEATLVAKNGKVDEAVAAKEKGKALLAAGASERAAPAAGGGPELAALFAQLREAASSLPEGVRQALEAAAGVCQEVVPTVEGNGVGTVRANVASGSEGERPAKQAKPEQASGNGEGRTADDSQGGAKEDVVAEPAVDLVGADRADFDAVLELLGKREDKGESILQHLKRSTPYGR